MLCKVRNPSRRGGWRSRERGTVGRRAAVRGFHHALDQKAFCYVRWFFGCCVYTAWRPLVLFSILILGFCRSAYAAPSIEIDGNFSGYQNGETYNGYMVVDCPNEYIATLTLIGEYSSLPQIDSDMYAKLSNESSGGRFYELVQEWDKVGSDGRNQNWPGWAGSTEFQEGLVIVYGYGRVWECDITDSLKSGAKEDFLTILDGGSLGGGGGGFENDGTYYYIKTILNNEDMPANVSAIYSGIALNTTYYNSALEFVSNHSNYQLWIAIRDSDRAVDIALSDKEPRHFFTDFGTWGCYNWDGGNLALNTFKSKCDTIQYNNETYLIFTNQTGNTVNNSTSTSGLRPTYSYYWGPIEGDIGGGEDDSGDNNWPDDDTPQPPTPNPPTPTTPDPDPGPPLPPIDPHDPVIPSPPTNEPAPTGTTPTDYTPWLRAILQQLVNLTSYLETCFTWLGTALDDHCQHIRDHMTTCFNWLGEYEITGMSNLLSEHHTFLNGLAQWIVDNLRWENSGGEFDDSNMIYWLRRIYARQGTGEVNTRPVDPATSYGSFTGWLGVLYDEIALDVSDTSLVALSASLSGLQHTFPFSLPWDIKQVLQALDVSPVTPSASIPTGTRGVTYDIDLHFMDSAMVSVRAFELLVFVVYVMVHTKDLFGYLMGD